MCNQYLSKDVVKAFMKHPYVQRGLGTWKEKIKWWKKCFSIPNPLSFKDANGDGIGDIQGIISKLGFI